MDIFSAFKRRLGDIAGGVVSTVKSAIPFTPEYTNRVQTGLQKIGATPKYQKFSSIVSKPLSNIGQNVKILSQPESASTWSKGFSDSPGGTSAKFLTNRYIAPVAQIPYNFKKITSPTSSLVDRGIGALGVAGGLATLVPDPIQDVAFPLIDYAKAARASYIRGGSPITNVKAGIKGLTLEEPVGLGSALTTDPKKELAGNIAELPLILASGKAMQKKAIGFNKNQVDLVRKGFSPEVRAKIGEFAQEVERNPYVNRKNLGLLGDYVQSVANTIWGDKASNLNNKQLKNAFDVIMKQAFEGKSVPKVYPVGLSSQSVRKTSNIKSKNLSEANIQQKTAGNIPQATPIGVHQKDFDRHVQVMKILGDLETIPTGGKLPSSIDVAKNLSMDEVTYLNQVRKAAGLAERPVPQLPKVETLPVNPAEALGKLPIEQQKNLSRLYPEEFAATRAKEMTSGLPPSEPPSEPPLPEEDIVKRFTQALKEFKPLRAEQEALYTKARGERLAEAIKVGQEVKGEAGFYAMKSKLGGKMPVTPGIEELRQKLGGQEGVDKLVERIKTSTKISEWDKFPAFEGLVRALNGGVPTEGQLKFLNVEYGPDFTKTVLSMRPFLEKITEAGYQLFNIPRAILSSMDMSMPLRQGIFTAARHPVTFAKALPGMVKSAFSKKAFLETQQEIIRRPTYKLMEEYKLPLTDIDLGLTGREEQFMSQWAEKIPLVGNFIKGSNRAAVAFLNKMRADLFDSFVKDGKKLGILDDPRFLQSASDFIGSATGRGGLGRLERAASLLNTTIFSPRLMASRLNLMNPFYYVNMHPVVRRRALESLVTFLGAGTSILGLASLNGADVGTDPRSADFGKIKVGNTRYDLWGGFQQYVRLFSQLTSGKIVSSTTGREMTLGEGYKPLTRLDIIERFIESKEAPIASLITEILKGKDFKGNEITAKNMLLERFIPMVMQDTYDLYKEKGIEGTIMAIPAFFGAGVQTYQPTEKDLKGALDVSYEKGQIPPEGVSPKMKAELVYSELNKALKEKTGKTTLEKLKQSGLNDKETLKRVAIIAALDKKGFGKKDRDLLEYQGEDKSQKIADRLDDFTKEANQVKHIKLLMQAGVMDKNMVREVVKILIEKKKVKE